MNSVNRIIRNGVWRKVLSQVRYTRHYRRSDKNIHIPLFKVINANVLSQVFGAIRVDKELTV